MFVVQKKNTCIPLIFHPTCPKPKNPKKVEWELSWAFHDVWAIKLPWVKVVMNPNYKKMFVVMCQVYISFEKKRSLLSPSLIICKNMLGSVRLLFITRNHGFWV